jgi:methylaspartate mutase sigma subunit
MSAPSPSCVLPHTAARSPRPRPRLRVLLTSVSSDSHTWNLVYLQLLLEELGCEVTNLGACVPDSLVIDTVRRIRPEAVVCSTVNGHGRIDGARMIRALRADPDPDVAGVPAIIGGKLGIDGDDDGAALAELLDAGFTTVFTDRARPEDLGRVLGALPARATAIGAASTTGATAIGAGAR